MAAASRNHHVTPATNSEQVEAVKRLAERLKAARELNGWTLREAAKRFNYANIGVLSRIETARHITTIPMWFVPAAAKVYNVTTDWLHGLVEDWDVDPRVRLDATATDWLQHYMEQARMRDMAGVRLLHDHLNEVSKGLQTNCQSITAVSEALSAFQRANLDFDDMRGGATLYRRITEAQESATAVEAGLQRYMLALRAARTCTVSSTTNSAQLGLDLAQSATGA